MQDRAVGRLGVIGPFGREARGVPLDCLGFGEFSECCLAFGGFRFADQQPVANKKCVERPRLLGNWFRTRLIHNIFRAPLLYGKYRKGRDRLFAFSQQNLSKF